MACLVMTSLFIIWLRLSTTSPVLARAAACRTLTVKGCCCCSWAATGLNAAPPVPNPAADNDCSVLDPGGATGVGGGTLTPTRRRGATGGRCAAACCWAGGSGGAAAADGGTGPAPAA